MCFVVEDTALNLSNFCVVDAVQIFLSGVMKIKLESQGKSLSRIRN